MQWHDIANADDPELDRLAAQYGIHPLHVEDCRHRGQRGKVEEGVGYLFVVMKPVEVQEGPELEFFDLDIFLGSDWVITVREGNPACAGRLLQPVHAAEARYTAPQIFYRICDGVVDSYLPVMDRMDDVIDELEEKVLNDPSPDVLAQIFSTRRMLIELRRVLSNTRDLTAHLYRAGHTLIPGDLVPFLRDVYDHVARNLDLVETQRDLLTGAMDVYLSSVANRTNQVMKVLTVAGTAALPALIISGFFGMNLKGLPFAESEFGTILAAGAMAISTGLLLVILKWFRWF